jgi:hypothetical protein
MVIAEKLSSGRGCVPVARHKTELTHVTSACHPTAAAKRTSGLGPLRVNLVALTLRRSLLVFPNKRTFSVSVGSLKGATCRLRAIKRRCIFCDMKAVLSFGCTLLTLCLPVCDGTKLSFRGGS